MGENSLFHNFDFEAPASWVGLTPRVIMQADRFSAPSAAEKNLRTDNQMAHAYDAQPPLFPAYRFDRHRHAHLDCESR